MSGARIELTPARLGRVALFAFGGAGLAMLAGAVALGAHGELGGAAGLGVFGIVFAGAGYTSWRLFSPARGMKEIEVAARTGDAVTERSFATVDERTSEAEVEALQRGWAERPWTQRGDWAAGKVVQEQAASSGAMLAFAVVFNLMGWGFAAIFLSDGLDAWPVLVFPAAGFVIAVVAVRARIRKRKFGTSVIECRTMPAWLGDRFQGTLQTGVPLRGRSGLEFKLRVSCRRRRTRFEQVQGKTEERVTEETLWNREEIVRGTISGKGPWFQVTLDIAIPEGLPATELLPEDDRLLWRLHLGAEDAGVDYAADFELPVYARRSA